MSSDATNWKSYVPRNGWEHFHQHDLLSEAIQDGLSEANGEWHYMNPTAIFSVWESCKDGSAITMSWVDAKGTQFVELAVHCGRAEKYLEPIIARFDLVLVLREGNS